MVDCRERARGLEFMKMMTDILAHLFPRIDSRQVADTTVQLGRNANIEIGIDGQVTGWQDCLSALPQQVSMVPLLACSISMFVFVSTD